MLNFAPVAMMMTPMTESKPINQLIHICIKFKTMGHADQTGVDEGMRAPLGEWMGWDAGAQRKPNPGHCPNLSGPVALVGSWVRGVGLTPPEF